MNDDDLVFDLDEVNSDIEQSMTRMGLTNKKVPNEGKVEAKEEKTKVLKAPKLNLDIFDPEKIKTMNQDAIIDAAAATVLQTKEVNFQKVEMLELAEEMPLKPNYELLKKHILVDEKDECFTVKIPVFEEAESEYFKIDALREGRYDAFPERNRFFEARATIDPKPLGLLVFDILIAPVVRVASDYRHNQISLRDKELKCEEQLCFYFDFKEKKFIEVYADKLQKAREKVEKNPSLLLPDTGEDEDDNKKNKLHPALKEYLIREQNLEMIMITAHKKSLPYLRKAKEWRASTYSDGNNGVSRESITQYLDTYEKFLENDVASILKVKLIFGNVTITEYDKTIKKINSLFEIIKTARLDNQDGKDIEDITTVLQNKLEKFKQIRPPEFPNKTILYKEDVMVGYFGYDLARGEMYPNILQLDARRGNSVLKEDFTSEEKYIKQALEIIRAEDEKQ